MTHEQLVLIGNQIIHIHTLLPIMYITTKYNDYCAPADGRCGLVSLNLSKKPMCEAVNGSKKIMFLLSFMLHSDRPSLENPTSRLIRVCLSHRYFNAKRDGKNQMVQRVFSEVTSRM